MVTTIIVLVVVVFLVAALRLWLTANRLDRLHVRTEAAWVALEGALSRRVVAARAMAAAGGLQPERAALLRGVARRAELASAQQLWRNLQAQGDRRSARAANERVVELLRSRAAEDMARYGTQLRSALEELYSARLRSGVRITSLRVMTSVALRSAATTIRP